MGWFDRTRLAPYLDLLRALPFVVAAEAEPTVAAASTPAARPWAVAVTTPRGTVWLNVQLKGSNVTELLAREALLRCGDQPASCLLCAPYVGPAAGRLLAEHGVNFVDAAGNLRLAVGTEYLAVVEGRRPVRHDGAGRGIRAAGYHVLFALLAWPELASLPVRTLADRAGVGKSAAAEMLRRLETERLLVGTSTGRRFLPRSETLDRWLAGYADVLRPRWTLGRFRTADLDPGAREARLTPVLRSVAEVTGMSWGWGGGAAAQRLTGHYRGAETVLLVHRAPADLAVRLRALRASDGDLLLMQAPAPLVFEGAAAETVHPLLVYAELVVQHDERAREAAAELRKRYLGGLP